jgi:hypothetical protein
LRTSRVTPVDAKIFKALLWVESGGPAYAEKWTYVLDILGKIKRDGFPARRIRSSIFRNL